MILSVFLNDVVVVIGGEKTFLPIIRSDLRPKVIWFGPEAPSFIIGIVTS